MPENRQCESITVWYSSGDPSKSTGLVYRWEGHAEHGSVFSLLRYVETHGERLRRTYLAWVHDLGESRIGDRRLVDHLVIEDGLSYWWMTPFVEQSPWNTASIVDALRLLALEEVLIENGPRVLRFVGADRSLHEVLSGLCKNLGIAYAWERSPEKVKRRLDVRSVYRLLPAPAQGLLGLARYLRGRWALRRAEKAGWFGGSASVFICSFFFHLDAERAERGHFHSRYWGRLDEVLNRCGRPRNWLQQYHRHDVVPNPQVALDWTGRFNRHREEEGFHTFVEAFLTWPIVLRALRRWFRLCCISWRLGKVRCAFRPNGSHFSLWPLMRRDWQASMRGHLAMINLLFIELFDAAIRSLPHQEKGLYLTENHPWERALIHAWRKYGHGQLVGVPHATVRFWDLRYFVDPRTIRSPANNAMPRPDLVALNGKAAIDAYLSVDYPADAIAECEALRFGYLMDLRAHRESRKSESEAIRVLILGDYWSASTAKMLHLLEAAVPHMSAQATYTAKPHPNHPIAREDYPSLALTVVSNPLEGLLHDFDVAYASNLTSAAADAYLAGLPVVVVMETNELNYSPLRGHPAARFVSTPTELAAALQAANRDTTVKPDVDEFFFLDAELPRWRRLLEVVPLPQ